MNTDKIPEPIHGHGQIYQIKNKSTGKLYIGQTKNFHSGNRLYCAEGRFKAHVSDAMSNRNYCTAIDGAIRKYGKYNFELSILEYNVPIEKLNEKEQHYIKELNTMAPNGYNLTSGGKANQIVSEETRKKISIACKGKKKSKEAIENYRKSLIGRRVSYMKRRNSEDNNLPKYIFKNKLKGKHIGYGISCFPIGIDKKEFISKKFQCVSDPESTYQTALNYLEELKKKYNYVEDEIKKQKEIDEKNNLKNKIKNKLPDYIHPILKNNQTIGYSVEGFKDNNGKEYEKKDFITKCGNYNNLEFAKLYLKKLEIQNKDNIFEEKFDKIKYPNIFYENNIPRGFKILYDKDNNKIGYYFIRYIIKNYKRGSIKKTFVKKYETLEEKFNNCITFINKVHSDYPYKI